MARLQAFESAGADVLYAPGLSDLNDIRALCAAVSKPVNVLARPNLTFQELADAGAQRVSVGGSLTWAAVQALVEAATAIRDRGDFSLLGSGPPADWLEPA
jgi:2-methylisocitrate lyase-like PEP mutase family enzyme